MICSLGISHIALTIYLVLQQAYKRYSISLTGSTCAMDSTRLTGRIVPFSPVRREQLDRTRCHAGGLPERN